MDALIRGEWRSTIVAQEPSSAVRETLLAEAARCQEDQLPVQESIPALVQGLEEDEPRETVHWWEAERSLFENFAMWDNPWRNPALAHVLIYHEASCYRMKGAAC